MILDSKREWDLDIVFLLDVSSSIKACIRAVTDNISTFIDTLSDPESNRELGVDDWRIRVIGYRDRDDDHRAPWWVENPFSSDAGEAKAHLHALEAKGREQDEPKSLLDAYMANTEWFREEMQDYLQRCLYRPAMPTKS